MTETGGRILAREHAWTEERALEIFARTWAAKRSERIELQLHHDWRDLFGITAIAGTEQRETQQALPFSETLERKAIDIAFTQAKPLPFRNISPIPDNSFLTVKHKERRSPSDKNRTVFTGN